MKLGTGVPPLNLDPVPEVPLVGSPLEKVLTQVVFSPTPELVSDEGERLLAAALAGYPIRRHGVSLNLSMGPVPGAIEQTNTATRQYADRSQSWVVAATEASISLETTNYKSRDDFCQRFRGILDAVHTVAPPPVVDRVGLRYINRLRGHEAIGQLNDYVNPRLCGFQGTVDPSLMVEHSVSDSLIGVGEGERMRVRVGLLPANMALDPATMPLDEPSWVLDIDIFTTTAGFSFEPEALDDRLRRYAEHIHSVFRWAVTDAFLQAHRGPPGNTEEVGG
ncbi:MAG: TIGR04255 family protein [Acidimicrobiales bacterium]